VLAHLRDLQIDLFSGASAKDLDVDCMITTLAANEEVVKRVDWSSFRFLPTCPPALNYYLQDPPLMDLLPTPVGGIYTEVLSEYYSRYLCTDYMWTRATGHSIYEFIRLARALEHSTGVLLVLLNPKQSGTQKQRDLDTLWRIIEDTNFFDKDRLRVFSMSQTVR